MFKKKAAILNKALSITTKNERAFFLSSASKTAFAFIRENHLDLTNGLNEEKVRKIREEKGKNSISKSRNDSWFKRLVKSFCSPFTIMLFVIAIINGILTYLYPESEEERKTWFLSPLIMITIAIFSSLVSFFENNKSLRTTKALKNMAENTSTCLRDGKFIEVSNEELVPNDIIRLTSGDMIPCDVRILQSKDFFVSQASLTGETSPVEKTGQEVFLNDEETIFDASSLAFQGSNVISGFSLAAVLLTGDNTIFGKLSKKVSEKKGKTSFEKGVDSVAKLLLAFIFVMVPLLFLINGLGLHFENGMIRLGDFNSPSNWISALVFSLTVAVGITPALLPLQVMADLSKGATNMAKKNVIVKDINTIQNLGAMDVLCTDKTGTLTENRSSLTRCISLSGMDSEEALKYTYLNSYYQSGIKSLLDKAVVEFVHEGNEIHPFRNEKYNKIDEIPFDSERKRLTVLLKGKDGKNVLISKGALESMLSLISHVQKKEGILPITDDDKKQIEEMAKRESNKGQRVILVAKKNLEKDFISQNDESDLLFLGFACFMDTPKKSAKKAIDAIRKYSIQVKILTGDSDASTLAVCEKTGIEDVRIISSVELNKLSDEEFRKVVEEYNIFTRLSPDDKYHIVKALKENKHTVSFMGDGINDAPALHMADVGISFRDATDIAKETSDVIMLQNNLSVLKDGIVEGRKSYINMMKFLKGQTSSNFGNMLSQTIGALFLPFIPLKALHVILLDLISSASCSLIPFDRVDEDVIQKPLDFSTKQIRDFMFAFGPLSTLIDLSTFAFLFYFICPIAMGGTYTQLGPQEQVSFMIIFQSGFFLESLLTQNVVYTFLRTDKVPLIQSRPNFIFGLGILLSCLIGISVIYIPYLNTALDFTRVNPIFFLFLLFAILIYGLLTEPVKRIYKKHYKRLL